MHDRTPTATNQATPDADARRDPGSADVERARLSAILRNLPDPVWLKDANGVYLACNARFETLRGRSESEIIGHTAEELAPDRADVILANDRRAIESGGPVAYEEWLTFADGHRELVETIKSPMYAEDGSLIGVLGVARDITAIRETEEALREQEEMFEAIVSQSADAMALIDNGTRSFLQFNDAACEGLGYSREEFERLRIDDIAAPESPVDIKEIGAQLGAGQTVRLETRHRHKDGSLREVDVSLRPLQLRGRPVGASVWRDVTESRRREAALRESREKLRTLFDAADVLITVHEADTGRVVEANASALAALGVATVDELKPEIMFAAQPPYRVSDALDRIRRAATEGRQRFDWVRPGPDGQPRWLDVIIEPVTIGDQVQVIAVAADVTERKTVELELGYHRQHLEEIVASRTAELAAANRRLTLSDLRMRAMLDLSQRASGMDERDLVQAGLDAAIGLTSSEMGYVHFINDDGSIELNTFSEKALAVCTATFASHAPLPAAGVWADSARQHRPVIHNDWLSTPGRQGLPDGHPPLRRHLSAPIFDDGVNRMVIGVGNKIESYDEHDAETLARVGEDLWRIVVRRRTETALARAKEDAEAANRAKSTFLANMSHEIRTPMNAIIGLTHLLREEPVSDQQDELLGRISESAEHLMGLLNQVLDLSKIEAGKLALEVTDFALADVLENLRAMAAAPAVEKGIGLRIDASPDVPRHLHGDGLRLGQILLNLVGNAIKFTSRGEVAVEVERNAGRGPNALRITIRDTGIGIAPADIDRLFQTFEQADTSTTRRYGGTGLGLAISRSLVELMGGTIRVRSEVGKGSQFTIELDLPDADEAGTAGPDDHQPSNPTRASSAGQGPASSTGASSAGHGPASSTGASSAVATADIAGGKLAMRSTVARRPGARVLLVEDSRLNQRVASELLRLTGVTVDVANDGQAAVRQAGNVSYDLILMDIQMPSMDGLAATREIRRIPGREQTPIVAMTANAFEDDRRACLDAGMNDHLGKPVNPDRLFETVARWIPADRDVQGAASAPPPSAPRQPRRGPVVTRYTAAEQQEAP